MVTGTLARYDRNGPNATPATYRSGPGRRQAQGPWPNRWACGVPLVDRDAWNLQDFDFLTASAELKAPSSTVAEKLASSLRRPFSDLAISSTAAIYC